MTERIEDFRKLLQSALTVKNRRISDEEVAKIVEFRDLLQSALTVKKRQINNVDEAEQKDDFQKLLDGSLKVKNRQISDEEFDENKTTTFTRAPRQKRSCENCICKGKNKKKLERNELKKMNKEEINKLTSSGCEGCKLGDAFRCANCPFYGLPAFEEGDEVFFD